MTILTWQIVRHGDPDDQVAEENNKKVDNEIPKTLEEVNNEILNTFEDPKFVNQESSRVDDVFEDEKSNANVNSNYPESTIPHISLKIPNKSPNTSRGTNSDY